MIYQSHTEELIASIYQKLSHPEPSHFFSKSNFLFPSLNIAQKNKHKLSISSESIALGTDTRTSVMIKNIPICISKEKIIKWIEMICEVNYIYIPLDQNGTKILGFSFVNVKNYKDIMKLCNVINNYVVNINNKKIEICYSKMQGASRLIKAFGKEFYQFEEKN